MKASFLFFILLLVLFSCNKESHFVINGALKGQENGMLYLKKKIDGKLVVLDSALMKNGKFRFKGKIEQPEMHFIFIDSEKKINVFLENSEIEIKAHVDSLNYASISGSQSHDIFSKYWKYILTVYDSYNSLQDSITNSQSNGKDSIANIFHNQLDSLMKAYSDETVNFVSENKNSEVGAYVLLWQKADQLGINELDSLIQLFDHEIIESVYVKHLSEILANKRSLEIGGIPSDFVLTDKDGNEVKFSSLKGNYLLLDFWASWCKPCRKENPFLLSSYEKYFEHGFNILSISIDENKDEWLAAIEKDKMKWLNVCDFKGRDGEVAKQFFVGSIPFNLLLNKEGKVIAKNLRGEELEKRLVEIFKL